jgi:hypothetical protein
LGFLGNPFCLSLPELRVPGARHVLRGRAGAGYLRQFSVSRVIIEVGLAGFDYFFTRTSHAKSHVVNIILV